MARERLTLALQLGLAPTDLVPIGVTPTGENSIIVAPGTNTDLRPEHVSFQLREKEL